MDSRDTASAAFDVARPADDAAGRGGLARASRGGVAPGDDRHAEQAGGLAADSAVQADGWPADSRPAASPAAVSRPAVLPPAQGLASRRNGPLSPATIYDVASAAGVSIASVSRVLNGRGNPMPETRERVLAAVAELGFIPDGAARALSVQAQGDHRRGHPAAAAHRADRRRDLPG